MPFGEYEAEVAGQKIVNGERPDLRRLRGNSDENGVRASLSGAAGEWPTLRKLRREFDKCFGGREALVKITNAINLKDTALDDKQSTIAKATELVGKFRD
ncbi:uncharacterized protein MONOS_7517 [Monocercomonoides exilis]|uniref:uncharacterized protein n=1 Tax=Monocercomonoides exilis TaxID=2049356 RepID=UPI003559B5AF|nr:hypothetical protein MONOS_7517 [Monocercomonoides exilis]|eukprot:MONOS_7517.1-p1 / transcript=MONOS_7517.1 / gene=MONOS_7517 / organism=Monocercomonoides_exilis_PA203 / gene_product=unspecified product / transcript_product=unspecified product / location=Mono_scaffold00258:74132-74431(-) / protein_length=100 / sequence_SO=supercontig / SO=protein_coding / is_pseudo=false